MPNETAVLTLKTDSTIELKGVPYRVLSQVTYTPTNPDSPPWTDYELVSTAGKSQALHWLRVAQSHIILFEAPELAGRPSSSTRLEQQTSGSSWSFGSAEFASSRETDEVRGGIVSFRLHCLETGAWVLYETFGTQDTLWFKGATINAADIVTR